MSLWLYAFMTNVPLEVTRSDRLNVLWLAAGVAAVLTLAFWTWKRTRPRRRGPVQQR